MVVLSTIKYITCTSDCNNEQLQGNLIYSEDISSSSIGSYITGYDSWGSSESEEESFGLFKKAEILEEDAYHKYDRETKEIYDLAQRNHLESESFFDDKSAKQKEEKRKKNKYEFVVELLAAYSKYKSSTDENSKMINISLLKALMSKQNELANKTIATEKDVIKKNECYINFIVDLAKRKNKSNEELLDKLTESLEERILAQKMFFDNVSTTEPMDTITHLKENFDIKERVKKEEEDSTRSDNDVDEESNRNQKIFSNNPNIHNNRVFILCDSDATSGNDSIQ